MLGFIAVTIVIILVILLFMARRSRKPGALRLSDVGTIIDRSLRAYRRHLVPLLLIATLLIPLGLISNLEIFFYGMIFFSNPVSAVWEGNLWSLLFLSSYINALGLGKTILSCRVAQVMQHSARDETVSLREALGHGRWGAVLGLAALLAIPSFIAHWLNLLGALVALLWAVAPAVLIVESLGPVAAIKRSAGLVRRNFSGLLNTLVPLWVIGWLIAGTPLFGSLTLINYLLPLSPELLAALWLLATALCNLFVAPLTAMGAFQFYRYVCEREAISVVSEPVLASPFPAFPSERETAEI